MKISEKDIGINPSARKGKKITVSRILRCPKASSKVSVGTCRSCPYFLGLEEYEGNEYVGCSFLEKVTKVRKNEVRLKY